MNRSEHNFGYSTDPRSGEPLYGYKPSLAGAPWQFRLRPDALEWRTGRRAGEIPYGRIRRMRLSFRPATMQNHRYVAEIWAGDGPRLVIASTSWKGIAEQERLDEAYGAFIAELNRRVWAAGTAAVFERGISPLRYWPGLAVCILAASAMAGLTVEALRSGALAGALFVAAFLAVFLWQTGRYLRRNRPGAYRPDAPPAGVVPPR